MRELLVICGTLSVLAWLYLLLFHGRFWQLGPCLPPEEAASDVTGPIAVIIPARDEAQYIGRAVSSLLAQRHVADIRIFVVDDNSTDGTAEAARLAISEGHKDKLQIISGRPLASGWTGKLWALHQGVDAALKGNPAHLLLTDADIEHAPDNVATLVSIADRHAYDLVSLMVKLHACSVAEKLLIPAFVFFFFMLYPPRWTRSPKKRIAGAAGGCVLIRPEALERAGGIAAIRSEIIDDCALARRVKRSGGRVWLGLSRGTRSLRSYNGFAEIARMIARTAFNQLQHSMWLLAAAVFGMALLYVLPLALLFSGSRSLALVGSTACGIMVFTYLPMVCFYGLRFAWALTLPFAAGFYMVATIDSAMKFWRGTGGEWKGRSQDRTDL